MTPIDSLLDLLEIQGLAAYMGEPVTQKDHALQAAALASANGAGAALVAAALLHDLGHILPASETAGDKEDHFHERKAAAWLACYFGPEVTEPVRLHVDAKRYLCTVEPQYRQRLSAASLESLNFQGGLLSLGEIREFERNPHHPGALRLRRWDDEAKIAGLDVPGLDSYRETLQLLLVCEF